MEKNSLTAEENADTREALKGCHTSPKAKEKTVLFCKFEAMQAFIVSFTLHQ